MTGLTVGVDIGGTKCLGVVLDGHDDTVAEIRAATPQGSGELIGTLRDVIRELVDVAGEVEAVGLGIAGQLDLEGVMRFSPNLVGADELPIRARLQDEIQLPLKVDNDANCAAVGELHHGAIAGVSDAVMVNLGTGIGSAVIIGGELYRGANGMAGEWGHTTLVHDGEPCACGRRGCWEAYGSGAALLRLARDIMAAGEGKRIVTLAGGEPDNVRGEHVMRAARDGDHEAQAVLDQYARWLAVGIANVTAALDPELVVIGGGLVADVDLFIEPVRRHYERAVLGAGHRPPVRILPAELGARAGALGAAIVARELV